MLLYQIKYQEFFGLVLLGLGLTYSRFTCPEKAVLFSNSFRAVLFFLLTQEEKMEFSQLKALISA